MADLVAYNVHGEIWWRIEHEGVSKRLERGLSNSVERVAIPHKYAALSLAALIKMHKNGTLKEMGDGTQAHDGPAMDQGTKQSDPA